MTTVTLTPSSTSPWTAPAGVTSVEVQCWAPGGNGAGGATNSHGGGGGGGGEFAQETSVAVTPGSNYTFTVSSGGSGGDTSFTGDTQTVTAHHGAAGSGSSGGAGGSGSTNTTHFSGGSGGTGSSGTGNRGGGGGGGGAGSGGAGGTGGNGTTIVGGSTGSAGTPDGGAGGAGAAPTGGAGGSGSVPGGGGGGGKSTSSALSGGGSGADGQIILTYTASTTHSGTSTLSGSGTLQATGAFGGSSTLSGSGTLTSGWVFSAEHVVLSGSGTLSGTRIGIISESDTLTGSGTLSGLGAAALFQSGTLSGSGSLSVPGVVLGFKSTLSGTGTLGVIGLGGHVAASAGGTTPYAHPGTSQVSVAPPGSSNWQYVARIGTISALQYSFVCPGGADKLTFTVQVPADYRNQLLNPGWQIRVTRGGHVIWTGRTDEPSVSSSGWTMTAVGDGNRGADFLAIFTDTWPAGEPDEAVNNAISRGLPWVNPGIGSPAGIWLGQGSDSGSQTIAALLNLVCTRGGLTWYANSQPGGFLGTDLSVFPLPTVVNRLLVVTDPVSRTLGGDINTIFMKYQVTAASSSTSGNQQATYAVTSVQNAASVAAHGVMETYVDLSSAGVMSAGAAQAVGNNVLAIYQRASFAGPFTAAYGQLTNTGGQPVDPGTDQAGTVCRLILTDYGYGGEVSPAPITFIVGAYSWDDFAQKATITPFQTLDQSLTGLLSMESTVLQPITTLP